MTRVSTLLKRAEARKKYEDSLSRCPKCTKPLVCKENLQVIRAGIGIESEAEINGTEALTLHELGFDPVGIRAKSRAAAWQSWLGNVESGSLFAKLQSMGAKSLNALFFGGTDEALSVLTSVSLKLNWCTGGCSRPKMLLSNSIDNKKCALKYYLIERNHGEHSPKKFRLTINNIAQLTSLESPKFTLGNSTWCVKVFRKYPNYLGISFMGDTSCKLIIMITVIGTTNSKRRTFSQKIEKTESFNDFIPWDELLKHENGFIYNDSVTIEIRVRINNNVKLLQMGCLICFECIDCQEVSSLCCGHLFCSECIRKSISEKKSCPVCDAPASMNDLRRTILPITT